MARSLFGPAARVLAEGLDRAFASSALIPRAPSAMQHRERVLALQWIERFYNRPEYFADPDTFFAPPVPIVPTQRRLRGFGEDGEVLELRWPSAFEPLWAEPALSVAEREFGATPPFDRTRSLRDKYLGVHDNRTAVARWYRHRKPARATALLLHGYMGGAFALQERMFPVRKLFAGGMDVVLSVLPFHGARRDARRGLRGPAFPSSDARFTIEGFRQLVHDHRGLIGYLERERASTGTIGVVGTSLGGYSAALLATLERLLFSVLFIPLGSIEEFVHQGGALPGEPVQQQELAALLHGAQRVINPCARPSLVAPERVVVIGGELDRVTGLAQARLLAEHFEVPVHTFPGGHILQIGRDEGLLPAFEMLSRAGAYAQPR